MAGRPSRSHTSNGTARMPVWFPKPSGTITCDWSPWPLLCEQPSPHRADVSHTEEIIQSSNLDFDRCLNRLIEDQASVEAHLQQRASRDPSRHVTINEQFVVKEPALENGSSEPSHMGTPLFPDQCQSMLCNLGEALKAIYLKQEGLEKSFETCLDRWHQKVVLDVTEKINGQAAYSPAALLRVAKRKSAMQGGEAQQRAKAHPSNERKPIRATCKAAKYCGRMSQCLEDMKALEKEMEKCKLPVEKLNEKKLQKLKAKEDTHGANFKDDTLQNMKRKSKELEMSTSSHGLMIAKAKRSAQNLEVLPKSLGGKLLHKIVHHPAFDCFCALVIILNSALIGISVQETIEYGQEARWMGWTAYACNFFFVVELIMRMSSQGTRYFLSEEWSWNAFDFALVVFSITDVVMTLTVGQGASRVGSGMKTIKMLRIVRIFRVFRFFRELSLLALMIADSIKSLCWALLMLTIIIYVFAISFTQACSDYKWAHENEERTAEIQIEWDTMQTQFGSLTSTVYFLVLSVLGGISWGEVSDTLMRIDTYSTILFFFYIFFTLLAVLNIITGVFVENAVETARSQRDYLASRERQIKEKYIMDMAIFFEKMDEDGSGTVTLAEMQKYFTDETIKNMFSALGIDPADMERLFFLLDDDGSGEVNVFEFLEGCLRLKGEAKSIDVHTCLALSRRIQNRIEDLFPEEERRFGSHEMLSV